MTQPADQSLTVVCAACGARLQVSAEMAGKRARCGRCREAVAIPASSGREDKLPPAAQAEIKADTSDTQAASTAVQDKGEQGGTPPSDEAPKSRQDDQWIGVDCRVCQTRMYGRPEHVGRNLKCPDCGAKTPLPPPPKSRPKKPLPAMEGDQYELWAADEQPLPSELLAREPKYIPVICWLCQSLTQATEDQIGQDFVCPDCGSKNHVPAPEGKKPGAIGMVPEGEEYQMDRPDSPADTPSDRGGSSSESPGSAGTSSNVPRDTPPWEIPSPGEGSSDWPPMQAPSAKARRPAAPTFADLRPGMPRWPVLTGYLYFLADSGTLARWFVNTCGIAIALVPAAGAAALFAAAGPGRSAVGALGAIFLLGAASILGGLWFLFSAARWLAIVVDSSDGLTRVENWPSGIFLDHFGELLYVLLSLSASAAPGWTIVQYNDLSSSRPELAMGITAGSILLFFPVFLLSALDENSPWSILSVNVLASWFRCPLQWLLFLGGAVLLVGGCYEAAMWLLERSWLALAAIVPVATAVAWLYFRAMGRLAWCIGEVTPVYDEAEAEPSP